MYVSQGRRSYHAEYTGSHPNSEVKLRRASLVLGWGTTRESGVTATHFFCICCNYLFCSVCSRRPAAALASMPWMRSLMWSPLLAALITWWPGPPLTLMQRACAYTSSIVLQLTLVHVAAGESLPLSSRRLADTTRGVDGQVVCVAPGLTLVAVHITQSIPDLIRTPKSSCVELP